jgi:hypothetical protein
MPQLTLTVSDEKYEDEFKPAFLCVHPVPLDEEMNPIMPEDMWVKEWVKRQIKEAYKQGKTKLAYESAEFEEDLVT